MAQIEVKKTVSEFIEIEFPAYRKDAVHVWKFISEDESVCVSNMGVSHHINPLFRFKLIECEPITAAFFNSERSRVLEILNEL